MDYLDCEYSEFEISVLLEKIRKLLEDNVDDDVSQMDKEEIIELLAKDQLDNVQFDGSIDRNILLAAESLSILDDMGITDSPDCNTIKTKIRISKDNAVVNSMVNASAVRSMGGNPEKEFMEAARAHEKKERNKILPEESSDEETGWRGKFDKLRMGFEESGWSPHAQSLAMITGTVLSVVLGGWLAKNHPLAPIHPTMVGGVYRKGKTKRRTKRSKRKTKRKKTKRR